MKNHVSTKTLVLIACTLGLSAAAFASEDAATLPVASATTAQTDGHGLLGQNYATLGYSYVDYHGTILNGHSFDFGLNQNLTEGVDAILGCGYLSTDKVNGGGASAQAIDMGVRAFTAIGGLKPYVAAGLGWEWAKAPLGYRANYATYFLSTGAEFQVARDFSVTPFVSYADATKRSVGRRVDYGVKVNYWISEHVGLTAAISRDNSRDMQYNFGVSFRY